VTDLLASQTIAEAWVASAVQLRSSQTVVEVWFRNNPATSLIVTQALAEVWIPSAVTPSYRRHQLSAQVV